MVPVNLGYISSMMQLLKENLCDFFNSPTVPCFYAAKIRDNPQLKIISVH